MPGLLSHWAQRDRGGERVRCGGITRGRFEHFEGFHALSEVLYGVIHIFKFSHKSLLQNLESFMLVNLFLLKSLLSIDFVKV